MLKYAFPAAVAALVAGLASCSSPPPPVYLQEYHDVTIEEKKVTPMPKPKPKPRTVYRPAPKPVESAEGFRAVY